MTAIVDRPLTPQERRALVEKPLPTFHVGHIRTYGSSGYRGGIPLSGRHALPTLEAQDRTDESYLRFSAAEEVEEWD